MKQLRYQASLAVLIVLIIVTVGVQGWTVALSVLTVGLISGVMALGLNIQWGYAGQFNAGVMGFSAIGAIACVLVSMPWVTATMQNGLETLSQAPDGYEQTISMLKHDIPRRLTAEKNIGIAWLLGAASAIAAWALNRTLRHRVRTIWRVILVLVVLIIGLALFRGRFDSAIRIIESTGYGDNSKYLGGMQLPILFAWFIGGCLAAIAAWMIGKIALGLRSDYLAIATLGISEIVIALLKNEGWLTRGVLNVTGLPSPVPAVKALQVAPYSLDVKTSLIVNKLAFLGLVVMLTVLFLWLAHRAWHSPWGRMMRAIRDNEEAAAAMGKDVVFRHRQVFIFGSFFLGVGGAMLATLVLQFEPAGYQPLRFTFLIWVMVIVGGSGNNIGSIVGGLLIWFLWVQAEPAASWLFYVLGTIVLPENSALAGTLLERAPQMRTLVMGLVLLIVLRFAPGGLLPESLQRRLK
ncbi:MAG: branched-chain amino acid ABC transporter permease [Acidiferrobacteraceae bacterium]|nr:branched-chain amino acid ABC transporter permease [Acidiferrobacteraceae bacterium]